jgi:hypothetical protein
MANEAKGGFFTFTSFG